LADPGPVTWAALAVQARLPVAKVKEKVKYMRVRGVIGRDVVIID
jgi:hypothetical protein